MSPEAIVHVEDLGRLPYEAAYEAQVARVEAVLDARERGAGIPGHILLVEHEPVVTVSRRPEAGTHLLATADQLAAAGVSVAQTDRGGDITYHGPGQLVVYPILDLNVLNLGLHDYMRLLESAVIETCEGFGVGAAREAGATGVWVPRSVRGGGRAAKICAMGVRVRRWVSMHGLALNVNTELSHFGLIVPCGLVGRAVTSLASELGDVCPAIGAVKRAIVGRLTEHIRDAAERAENRRRSGGAPP